VGYLSAGLSSLVSLPNVGHSSYRGRFSLGGTCLLGFLARPVAESEKDLDERSRPPHRVNSFRSLRSSANTSVLIDPRGASL